MSLPVAERLGARSRCWIAPAGTKLTDAGWKPIGWTSLDGFDTPEQQAADAREKYCIPQRFLAGVEPQSIEITMTDMSREALELYYGAPITRVVLGNESPTERSKPLGLTKEHTYTDNDGDTLTVEENHEDDLAIVWISNLSPHGFNVTAENSIALALNVLGFDRPSSGLGAAGATRYNGQTADGPIPTSKLARDANVAEAIDLLIGADIFDQREAGKAERVARIKARDDARSELHQILTTVALNGVSVVSIEGVQQSINKYKAAVDAVGAPSEL